MSKVPIEIKRNVKGDGTKTKLDKFHQFKLHSR